MHEEIQRRFASADLHVEPKEHGDGRTTRSIVGYAAVFNQWSSLIREGKERFREIIRPGAFRHALSEGQDVRALINHNPALVIGRTRSGTLRLEEDARGLKIEIDPPDTQAARDLMVSMERGDIGEMSFAYLPRKDGLKRSKYDTEREITDVNLLDVSMVAYPAYKEARALLRADMYDCPDDEEEVKEEVQRSKAANLVRMQMRARLLEARFRGVTR